MLRKSIVVRRAEAGDLDALTELRLDNGRVHAELDPAVYRVPDRGAVEEHFRMRIAQDPALWVATAADGSVTGMVEVVRSSAPPEDQILRDVPTAQVHIVVRSDVRGRGVGKALLQHAEQWAAAERIERLIAGIQAHNRPGLTFYDGAGYVDNGYAKIKNLSVTAA